MVEDGGASAGRAADAGRTHHDDATTDQPALFEAPPAAAEAQPIPGRDSARSTADRTRAAADSPGPARFVTGYVPPPPIPQFKNRRRLTPEEAEDQRRRRAARRRRRRVAGVTCLGAGALILLAAGWVSWRVYQAYSHLQAASDQVSVLQTEIKDITSIDLAVTDVTVGRLQQESDDARSAVQDPFYLAASHLPWIGANLGAIRVVTTTVDSLAVDVVPSLVQIATTLNPASLAPKDGTLDLAPIEAASPLLQKADAAVNASRVQLAGINRQDVVKPVSDAVIKLWHKLDQASSVTATGARVARLLPPMLGSTGRRTYLVAFQNLAEVRTTGGIFGSFAVLRVDHGQISIVDSGRASASLGIFAPPVEQLPPALDKMYTNRLATYPQDVNLRPDFPSAAALFAKMYTQRKGTVFDGVIATDPVALSYAMQGLPPISIGGGISLTSSNVVATLLSTVYSKFPAYADQPARDAFLARATTAAFQQVVAGHGSDSAVLAGLERGVGERRILVWSAHSSEQADIAATQLAGTLSTDSAKPSIGVFLNDGTAAKLDYYLTNSVRVTPAQCEPDGRRALTVTVTLSYHPPTQLPRYVLGDLQVAKPYVLQTNVMVFAPVGGGLVSASQDGVPGVDRGEDRSREVGQLTAVLSPGQTSVLMMTVLAPVSASTVGQVSPALILTPGVHPWQTSVTPYRPCGHDR